MVGVFEDSEFSIDQGQDFVCEEVREKFAMRFRRDEDWVEVRDVFVAAAIAGTVDADDDNGFDGALADEFRQGLIDLPLVMKTG